MELSLSLNPGYSITLLVTRHSVTEGMVWKSVLLHQEEL